MTAGHRTRPAACLDLRFDVTCSDPALAALLDELLAAVADDGPAAVRYSVLEEDDRIVVAVDGTELTATDSPSMALSTLLWDVNRRAVDSTTGLLLVHAAAAAAGQRAVVVPAPMETGKSTLVAALVQHGLRYVTDEAVAVRPTGAIVPYPKWLALDPGSWPLVPGFEPVVDGDARRYAGDQWHVPVAAFAVSPAVDLAPAVLIAPRRRPGAAAALDPMARAEALSYVAANAFNFVAAGRDGLDAAVALVEGSRCFRLTYDDVTEAAAAVAASL